MEPAESPRHEVACLDRHWCLGEGGAVWVDLADGKVGEAPQLWARALDGKLREGCERHLLVNASGNQLGDRGAAAFLSLWWRSPELHPHVARAPLLSLELRENDLSDSGLPPLVAVLAHCSSLEALALEGNCFTERGAAGLIRAADTRSGSLKLTLAKNFIEADALERDVGHLVERDGAAKEGGQGWGQWFCSGPRRVLLDLGTQATDETPELKAMLAELLLVNKQLAREPGFADWLCTCSAVATCAVFPCGRKTCKPCADASAAAGECLICRDLGCPSHCFQTVRLYF